MKEIRIRSALITSYLDVELASIYNPLTKYPHEAIYEDVMDEGGNK